MVADDDSVCVCVCVFIGKETLLNWQALCRFVCAFVHLKTLLTSHCRVLSNDQ